MANAPIEWRKELIRSGIYTLIVAVLLFVIAILFVNVHNHGGMFLDIVLAPAGLVALLFGRASNIGWVLSIIVEFATLFIIVLLVRIGFKKLDDY